MSVWLWCGLMLLVPGLAAAQDAAPAPTVPLQTVPVVPLQSVPAVAPSGSGAPSPAGAPNAPGAQGSAAPATPAAPTIPQPPGPAPDVWMPAGTAELRLMNKVDSHPETRLLQVGQQTIYGSLTISLKSCLARPIDQVQDWAAYLDIVDSHQDEPSFHGWMLANEPWIGMLEHPVYDVRLVACH